MKRPSGMKSLRNQLTVGAIALLTITVAAVSCLLIVHQRNVLTSEIRGSAILQGRNLALTSEKFLLRVDPEFELFPMIQRLMSSGSSVASVVVVDDEDTILGHSDLKMISSVYTPDLSRYTRPEEPALRPDEALYENASEYVFVTGVYSQGQTLGRVYLTYTKDRLQANLRQSLLITLLTNLGVLLIGVGLSLAYFRHISRPMQILLDGVESLDGDNMNVTIAMPTSNEFAMLADAFNAMSIRIDDARRTMAAKERMQHELELARDIQQSLLPRAIHPPRGYTVDHYYQAAQEVGGDYVDLIPLDNDRVAMAMGDVSGKGIQGLVVMAMVKTLFQQIAPRSSDVRSIVCDLNAALYGHIKSNMFVTFVAAIFDARTGTVTASNAGHNPLLVYRAATDSVERIRMGAPPLGAFGSIHFDDLVEEREFRLDSADAAMIYTDGINESRDRDGNLFTIARVEECLRAYAPGGARAVVKGVIGDAAEFRGDAPQADDLTLLVLKAPAKVPVGTTEPCEAGR